MTSLKPTFSQLSGRRYEPSVSLVEWFSKDGAAEYRREEVITLLAPKIVLDQWVEAMDSEGATSDCMRLIEECVQGSLLRSLRAGEEEREWQELWREVE